MFGKDGTNKKAIRESNYALGDSLCLYGNLSTLAEGKKPRVWTLRITEKLSFIR